MTLLPYALGVAASVSTYLGGRLALRVGRRDLLFGLTGGMVIGLALLDLLPAAVAGARATDRVFGIVAGGMALAILLHRLPGGAAIGRASLIAHSVIDGLAIGLAFQVAAATGWLVAAAVLAHDMADGANIVAVTAGAAGEKRAHRWLVANAAAPLPGVLLGQAMPVDAYRLALLLALFAGGFLYVGAAELLPLSRGGRGPGAGVASLAGIGLIACVTHGLG